MRPSERGALLEVLAQARRLGFLGPGPLGPQLDHAAGFAEALATVSPDPPPKLLDLGSGGGLPGLVLAVRWSTSEVLLLEAGERRAGFLAAAVLDLGLDGRVDVVRERAEEAGRGRLRASMDAVVARSFGPPAVTAECAAPFLRLGGFLVSSGPPDSRLEERWPVAGLARLGLGRPRQVTEAATYELVTQLEPCPERYPRRTGVPAKRPLF